MQSVTDSTKSKTVLVNSCKSYIRVAYDTNYYYYVIRLTDLEDNTTWLTFRIINIGESTDGYEIYNVVNNKLKNYKLINYKKKNIIVLADYTRTFLFWNKY